MSKKAERMNEVAQRDVCARFGAGFAPAPAALKLGIALATVRLAPLNGLRHTPVGDTTGWYIWGGEGLSQDVDFFQPLCVVHLLDHAPSVIRYLGLPPGWRFLITGDYEDVWFDETLLAP